MTRATVTPDRTRSAPRSAPNPRDPSTWPVIWRVLAPHAGSYDHDSVYIETAKESDARSCYAHLRRRGYPVRLERVSVGPLPKGAEATLAEHRAMNPQNPGTTMRPIPGAWESRP
jgi:hypothetical protein